MTLYTTALNDHDFDSDLDTMLSDPKGLRHPAFYLNREMTWLSFNERVLSNAFDTELPLLERIKFLAIVGSNLDEFFMKRIGGLYQQVYAGIDSPSVDGLTAQEQIKIALEYVSKIEAQRREAFDALYHELQSEGIYIRRVSELNAAQGQYIRDYFRNNIYPLVTPQSTDPAHPFPFVSNLSLNLLVSVRVPESDKTSITRIKIPLSPALNRFVILHEELSETRETTIVPIEDIIKHNLDLLLPGMEVQDITIFRVTRNAITEKAEEQAEDLLELIELELRERRFAPIVRLQIEDQISDLHREMLVKFLGVDAKQDVFPSNSLIGTRDLMQLLSIDRPDLKDKKHVPVDNAHLTNEDNIFQAIRQRKFILLHHPYESFSSSVERFLYESSKDDRVLAIKMTLYRTSDDSKIIQHLINAAQNGKQVTVVMEIKATFDESANIRWAQHLEQSGIHVTYGVVGLKTHCKVIHVIRRDDDTLVRYSHIGTGNYHGVTARLYTDLGVLTYDQGVGSDLTELFNYLTTGFTPKRNYQHISPAPKHLKPQILELIRQVSKAAGNGEKARIMLKVNALEDKDVVEALYRASMAGAELKLLIRDTCRIIPHVEGLSDNIRVRSVVGRFLEHSRIYQFIIGDREELYISSADMMKRNLESRVEVMLPIQDPDIKTEINHIIDLYWQDNVGAWEMLSDGRYFKVEPQQDEPYHSVQKSLISHYKRQYKESQRLKVRKVQSL